MMQWHYSIYAEIWQMRQLGCFRCVRRTLETSRISGPTSDADLSLRQIKGGNPYLKAVKLVTFRISHEPHGLSSIQPSEKSNLTRKKDLSLSKINTNKIRTLLIILIILSIHSDMIDCDYYPDKYSFHADIQEILFGIDVFRSSQSELGHASIVDSRFDAQSGQPKSEHGSLYSAVAHSNGWLRRIESNLCQC